MSNTARAVRSGGRDEYAVRWFEPGDRDDFLSLYSQVYGEVGEDWFEWKYEDVPYVDRAPIVVVDHEGTVVGARPTVALPLRIGDETVRALQQVDLVVHPDHRRRGLFTRLVERLYDAYESRREAVTFTFANYPARRGYEKMDAAFETPHSYLGTFSRFERVQYPSAFVGGDSRARRVGTRLASPVVRAYLAARDRRSLRSDYAVRRRESLPVDVLTRLYERDVPEAVHVRRDESFYRWRFAAPGCSVATYVAGERSEPVAAVVVCTRRADGVETVEINEVLPMSGGDERDDAVSALIGAVVADHGAADRLTVAGDSVPDDVLGAHGFWPASALPLSRVVDPTYVVARPLGDRSPAHLCLEERDADPDRWRHTYCVRTLG